jgi:hypothetical protein
MDPAQLAGMLEHVTSQAVGEGLNYRFADLVVANTFTAHRLIHLARDSSGEEAAGAVKEALLSAHFEKGLDIQRKFPELKGSRIVAAYRPGEKLAHFVIVSGPYSPVTQAYDAAKRSGLPQGTWVRSTRNLLDQLKAPATTQDITR